MWSQSCPPRRVVSVYLRIEIKGLYGQSKLGTGSLWALRQQTNEEVLVELLQFTSTRLSDVVSPHPA